MCCSEEFKPFRVKKFMPRPQSILVHFRFLFKIPQGYPVLFIWETLPQGSFSALVSAARF